MSDWTCTQQDKSPGSSSNIGGSRVEGPNMVPSSLGDAERLSTAHSSSGISAAERGAPEIIPQLAVWPVSGRDTEAASFLQKLQTSCLPPGRRSSHNHTSLTLTSGLASVQNGVTIPFRDL